MWRIRRHPFLSIFLSQYLQHLSFKNPGTHDKNLKYVNFERLSLFFYLLPMSCSCNVATRMLGKCGGYKRYPPFSLLFHHYLLSLFYCSYIVAPQSSNKNTWKYGHKRNIARQPPPIGFFFFFFLNLTLIKLHCKATMRMRFESGHKRGVTIETPFWPHLKVFTLQLNMETFFIKNKWLRRRYYLHTNFHAILSSAIVILCFAPLNPLPFPSQIYWSTID